MFLLVRQVHLNKVLVHLGHAGYFEDVLRSDLISLSDASPSGATIPRPSKTQQIRTRYTSIVGSGTVPGTVWLQDSQDFSDDSFDVSIFG